MTSAALLPGKGKRALTRSLGVCTMVGADMPSGVSEDVSAQERYAGGTHPGFFVACATTCAASTYASTHPPESASGAALVGSVVALMRADARAASVPESVRTSTTVGMTNGMSVVS